MSSVFITIAGAMFSIPLVVLLGIAITGADIPATVLFVGGWSMALGLITGGIGAVIGLLGG